MAYPQDQLEELLPYCAGIAEHPEGGITYILLEGLVLPAGCTPSPCDALLCPAARDGYAARLFFAHPVTTHHPRNWNGNARILERNWVAYSWNVNNPNVRLVELLRELLGGLTRKQ